MSFNTGLSGLRAAQLDLSVTGNNIANASTKGFKQSRAEFGDVYSASILGTGRNSVGSGVLVERVSQQHTQGNTDYTDRALDMAIHGNGYFELSNNGQIEYTRAGYFNLDKEGYIINNTNKRLQGYEADVQGNIGGVKGDIRLSQTNIEPRATTEMDIELNLDSRKSNLSIADFHPSDRPTYSDSNSTKMYDSLGNEHVLTQYFIKTEADDPTLGNSWSVINAFNGKFFGNDGQALYVDDPDPAAVAGDPKVPLTAANWDSSAPVYADDAGAGTTLPGTPATLGDYLVSTGTGAGETMAQATLFFNPQGSLLGNVSGYSLDNDPSTNPTVGVPFKVSIPTVMTQGAWVGGSVGGGAGDNEFEYNLRGTTQYGASYSAQAQYQDGYTTGRLAGVEVNDNGTIFGRYTNGQNRAVGRVPLVTFRNPEGLKPNGSTAWLETSDSGIPTENEAGTGITGTIEGGALEESNVDLAEELVKMIIGQRNYQANAKTIQTQDTITQTIINLR